MVTNITRNDCRLLHSGVIISKKERRRKLFLFNMVTTVSNLTGNLDFTTLAVRDQYWIKFQWRLKSLRSISSAWLAEVCICKESIKFTSAMVWDHGWTTTSTKRLDERILLFSIDRLLAYFFSNYNKLRNILIHQLKYEKILKIGKQKIQ